MFTPGALLPPLLGYLLGSVPFGYLLGRAFKGIDIRRYGSHNIGATNVLRVVGPLPALLTLLLDTAKGLVPVVAQDAYPGFPERFDRAYRAEMATFVEVIAGLLVAIAPRIGAWVVGLWLCGIIVNLLVMGAYFDVALRDLGLALGAFALARLSADFSEL